MWIAIAAVVLVAVAVAAFFLVRDQRIEAANCDAVHTLDLLLGEPVGTGEPLTVVGDSYTQGWGLEDPTSSWVAELPNSVTIHAASGSGFTRGGLCDGGSITELAEGVTGATILQGGLNDVSASPTDLHAAVSRAIDVVDGDVVLVGPALAPAVDAAALERVDAVLAEVAAEHDVVYISALGWDLEYSDGIHLTEDGHQVFGEMVAAVLE